MSLRAMVTILAVLITILGMAITLTRRAAYHKIPGHTAHGEATILATGVGVTFLAGFLAMFLESPGEWPGVNGFIVGIILALFYACLTYGGARFVLWALGRRSK